MNSTRRKRGRGGRERNIVGWVVTLSRYCLEAGSLYWSLNQPLFSGGELKWSIRGDWGEIQQHQAIHERQTTPLGLQSLGENWHQWHHVWLWPRKHGWKTSQIWTWHVRGCGHEACFNTAKGSELQDLRRQLLHICSTGTEAPWSRHPLHRNSTTGSPTELWSWGWEDFEEVQTTEWRRTTTSSQSSGMTTEPSSWCPPLLEQNPLRRFSAGTRPTRPTSTVKGRTLWVLTTSTWRSGSAGLSHCQVQVPPESLSLVHLHILAHHHPCCRQRLAPLQTWLRSSQGPPERHSSRGCIFSHSGGRNSRNAKEGTAIYGWEETTEWRSIHHSAQGSTLPSANWCAPRPSWTSPQKDKERALQECGLYRVHQHTMPEVWSSSVLFRW